MGSDGWAMAKKEVSSVPRPARWLRNGACGAPMTWSKEWFSSTTTMIRPVDGAPRAAVVGGLVGVVPTGP